MLFINRLCLFLLVAVLALDAEVEAFRYYKRTGINRFRPVFAHGFGPAHRSRFGFVRAENPNADGAMDAAKSGEESSETVPAQAAEMDGMPVHDSHAPQMREMIHDSPHPVEIDMGPGMQARIMGFEGEVEEGNFGRAAEGEENEEEGGAQFRHFKHKHKKQKHVIHTHHHYHHKKGYGGHGGGYGHGEGYGHHGHDHGYGHHGHGGGHGYHGGHDEGDDYEPSYGHHGRYRRSPMSETAPMDEEEALDAQALDHNAPTHSSQDHPTPNETGPSTVAEPGTSVYRQSVSRRQLVRSKNERLAQIGRDRAQRANSPGEPLARAVRNLVFNRNDPRMTQPFGGRAPTSSTSDRRRQRQELRRRTQNAPQTRPMEAFKNAINSIRQRMMPAPTTLAPTTMASKRLGGRRMGRTKNGRSSSASMVAAPQRPPSSAVTSAPPLPSPPPAPINCAECRRLCNVRGRARSRPLGGLRRGGPSESNMVASAGVPAAEGDVVASAGTAEGGNGFQNFWSGLFDPMVGNSRSGGEGSYPFAGLIDNWFSETPIADGFVAAAQDQEGPWSKFWSGVFDGRDETVSAKRDYGDESLPYCEDVTG